MSGGRPETPPVPGVAAPPGGVLSPDVTAPPGGTPAPGGAGRDGASRGGGAGLLTGAGLALFALAVLVGAGLGWAGRPVRAPAAPLFAHWQPHLGPGTPVALATAVLVILYGPTLAARLRWRWLLAGAYLAALCWTFSLALVDGWQAGLAGRLTTEHEYLSEVAGVTDVSSTVAGFAGRILDGRPDSWTTHVAGHPPGALLVFVGLDRLGLDGGGWAGVLCVAVGASVAVTVPLTLWALGGGEPARAVVPFMVLFPGAVWVGAAADGLFAGVTTAGIALLAGATRWPGRRRAVLALAAGVLLGSACFLSYGLVLMAPVAAAVLIVAAGRGPSPGGGVAAGWWPWPGGGVAAARWGRAVVRLALPILPGVAVGVSAVVAAFAFAGFAWLDGYELVVQRYYQGIAADRPYGYWVWANLACLVVAAGPVVVTSLRRAVSAGPGSPLLVPVAAAVAVVLADLSGLSKAEVERIWLPFTVWLVAATAALPSAGRRGWLAAQAGTALLVDHLLRTPW